MTTNLFVGHNSICLEQVDSSNNYARKLVRDNMPVEGTVIVAKEQTKGRGQRENSWLSAPGLNLTCSYILTPVFLSATNQFALSAAVALSVFETLVEYLPQSDVKIKWPNDVLVGEKKIAGILIENTLRKSNLDTSIAGIGINVNQVDFDDGLNATSIKIESGLLIKIDDVLNVLNQKLEKNYLKLRAGKSIDILKELNQHLFGIGKTLEFSVNGKDRSLKVIGTSAIGELELEHPDGRRALYQHHEITWKLKP